MSTELTPSDLHVVHASVRACLALASPEEIRSLLLADEDEEILAIGHADTRAERLVARAGLRRLLSRYERRRVEEVLLTKNARGKPGPSWATDLRFNVAHAAGVVVWGFARGREIGVDTEGADRPIERLEELTEHVAPPEREWLDASPEDERRAAFLRLWTLKEAFVKAKGEGLSYGLDRFVLDLDAETPSVKGGDDPSTWQLAEHKLMTGHVVAVAAARRPDEVLDVTWRELDPRELVARG